MLLFAGPALDALGGARPPVVALGPLVLWLHVLAQGALGSMGLSSGTLRGLRRGVGRLRVSGRGPLVRGLAGIFARVPQAPWASPQALKSGEAGRCWGEVRGAAGLIFDSRLQRGSGRSLALRCLGGALD